MLELKNIKKTYKIGEFETNALDGVSVAFREREFVAILGESGSGKTTCLNIIGGLDRYDSGEMTIKGKNTATFKDKDWDAYRNNSVGFVFQSYNLITHLSIVANVELGMTLSGVSKSEKRNRAREVLVQVGLKDHLHKKPNQLSGGQMQRVAIARALANDPEILLCDEPTGALDSATSEQIMDLITDLSKERLVIMVTHNPEIAEKYADRTIRLKDGKLVSDTNPHIERVKPDMFSLKKTAMNFLTALNLSGNNILTKKGRTFLTAFASSIGIIGIATVLSLSNGVQIQIDKFQEDAMSEFPIIISKEVAEFDANNLDPSLISGDDKDEDEDENKPPPTEVTILDPNKFYTQHSSKFTPEYLEYINNIDPEVASYVGYQRMISVNAVKKDDDTVKPVTFPTIVTMMMGGGMEIGGDLSSMMGTIGLSTSPVAMSDETTDYMEKNYELLGGQFPTKPTDALLIVGGDGKVEKATLDNLGFDTKRDTIPFDEILNAKYKLVFNNDYYDEISAESIFPAVPPDGEGGDMAAMISQMFPGMSEEEILATLPEEVVSLIMTGELTLEEYLAGVMEAAGEYPNTQGDSSDTDNAEDAEEEENPLPDTFFVPSSDYDKMWESDESVDVNITGIIRLKDDTGISLLSNGVVYSDELLKLIVENCENSDIVKAQNEREESVFPSVGGESVALTKDLVLSTLGANDGLVAITIYPTSFANKDLLLEYLDGWNEGKTCTCVLCDDCKKLADKEEYCDDCKADDCEMVIYTDLAAMILGFMSNIINALTVVLIAFAAISLIVSLIMIAIITYISVLERTKEIGILRALGARKKDITRVFDAETFIIGAFSGIIGVVIAYLITIPANVIIEDMTNLPNVAQLNPFHAIFLVVLSTALTVLGGHLPARMASKRNAVEALRSE